MKKIHLALLLAAVACAPVLAQQTAAPSTAPSSVLQRIKSTGKITIAHRESSVPFSFVNGEKKPMGYAVDLCLKIAEAVRKSAGLKDLRVEFAMVSPANRIAVIEEGRADLECGSTTNNAERRKKVGFTIPHFITGARLMVKSDSTVEKIEDLMGRKLVSTRGTTPLQAAEQANRERLMGLTILSAPDHANAVGMVEKNEAQAFLMDDVLLFGLIANRPDPTSLKVVGKFLTTEALAIMLPRDDRDFKKVVDDEMRRLILSREIYAIYDRWFMQPTPPNNSSLNMPVSYLLRDFWKYPSDFVPF